ncbi:hypothetical protein SO802_023247 [Lithocarpus litseifolius]|uniref:Ribonuclease H1 N-terminal domain-containing protein n=1 Tax=Lithocarpus litseifolius TaxID=425828 RepID=A0AAW2C9N9_9ROSI
MVHVYLVAQIINLGGRYYVVFIGRAPGIYDNWAEASRQVHKFANVEHRSFKDRREAESAYTEFLQRNGSNVQYGASPSFASPTQNSASSPGGTSQSEGPSYFDGDVRNRLLRYQLDVAIEERDHARRIATLSTNMLSDVVAHVLGDDEVHDSTRQGGTK